MQQANSSMQQDMQKLVSSPEGQKLMKLLSGDGGKTIRAAAAALQQGDERKAQETIGPMLKSPEAQKLMAALEKAMGHG